MPRGFIGVNRVSDEDAGYQKESGDNLSPWMQRVVEQVSRKQETASEAARKRQSIVHEINHIRATKPRYATVDDAVEDMRNRTGLNSYLTKVQSDQQNHLKKIVAAIMDSEVSIPESLKKYDADAIIVYIKNNIDNVHGLSATIPQLQHDIEHTFKINPADIRNEEVENFLSNLILEARSTISPEAKSPYLGQGVGKEDFTPSNPFELLEPASK